jgi:hypothetical protein
MTLLNVRTPGNYLARYFTGEEAGGRSRRQVRVLGLKLHANQIASDDTRNSEVRVRRSKLRFAARFQHVAVRHDHAIEIPFENFRD